MSCVPAAAIRYPEGIASMKKFWIALGVLLAVLVAWFVYSRVVQSRRDARYRQVLTRFQRDLPLGMNRAKVETYLKSNNIAYSGEYEGGSSAMSFMTRIGEDPGDIICASWIVTISFDFRATENKVSADPLPTDTLKKIRIEKAGDCP